VGRSGLQVGCKSGMQWVAVGCSGLQCGLHCGKSELNKWVAEWVAVGCASGLQWVAGGLHVGFTSGLQWVAVKNYLAYSDIIFLGVARD
jgi:hypothetical protein